jgi:hypothetical protein
LTTWLLQVAVGVDINTAAEAVQVVTENLLHNL